MIGNVLHSVAAVSVVVRPNGMASTGERYQLTCTVTNGASNVPLITWMNSGALISSNTTDTYLGQIMTSGTVSTSVLVLNPLTVDHNGNYTCQAVLLGMTYTYTYPVIVMASKLHT